MRTDPRQLELVLTAPGPRDKEVEAETLRRRLSDLFERDLRLVLTRNRSRIASVKEKKSGFELRLHQSFLDAEPATVEAVATFFNAPPGPARQEALGVLREHFSSRAPESSLTPPQRPRGACHDLAQMRDRINGDYFGETLDVHITWGQNASGRKRRRRGAGFSIRLGSYDESTRLVRIHPVLDRPEVPSYVVAAVVYHEMLHAAVPPERHGARRRVHTAEFRRRERLFRDHDRAEAWLAEHAESLAAWRGR
ncbi:MAG: hypothetical protein AAGM22_07295 [Acidobacteriota bacterium]